MYISKVEISNFRSYASATFEFGKLNVIRGLNASGKSSLADAIEFALTGRCRGTDEGGKGASGLIRTGAKSASVTLHLLPKDSESAVNVRLTRILKESGTQVSMEAGGRTYTGRQVEEKLASIGMTRNLLTAALRVGRFAELDANDQKELLADLLKPEAIKVPKEFIDWAEKTEVTLEDLREIEKGAIEARAGYTATLRELGDPEPVPDPPKGQPSLTETRKKLDGLRAEQQKLSAKKATEENTWATKDARKRALPGLITAAQNAILDKATEEFHLAAIDNEPKRAQAVVTLEEVRSQLKTTDSLLATARKQEGVCPTCKQNWDTEELIADLEKKRKALSSRIPGLEGMIHNCADPGEARNALYEHRHGVVDAEKLSKELESLAELKLPTETLEWEKEINALEERIQKGQQVLIDLSTLEEKRSAYDRAKAQRAELEQKREQADKVAKWAGPNGVQAQMTGDKLPAFLKTVNSSLAAWNYGCDIRMEPFAVVVHKASAVASIVEVSEKLLSESEHWRLSLALQIALAKLTGIGLAILDRADVLAGASRGLAMRAIAEAGLDQAFILASAADRPKLPPVFTVFNLTIAESGETQVEKEQ